MLEQTQNGCAVLQRNELAEEIGCVPSQINYVLTSRFTPEQGYIVESRRGGGGYIRIRRIQYRAADVSLDACGEYNRRYVGSCYRPGDFG